MRKMVVLTVVLMLFAVSPVLAKEGTYFGVYIPTDTFGGTVSDTVGNGTGWGLRLGSGFNQYFAIEGNYTFSSHDITGGGSADLRGIAIDFKVNFPLTTLDNARVMAVEPYLLFGYDYFQLQGSADTIKSTGVQYGVGVELYLFQELSALAGLTKSPVAFDTDPKEGGKGAITTLNVGITYHFI